MPMRHNFCGLTCQAARHMALLTCVQAFAEEVTNLQKQDAGPEELQQKLVQVGHVPAV